MPQKKYCLFYTRAIPEVVEKFRPKKKEVVEKPNFRSIRVCTYYHAVDVQIKYLKSRPKKKST